MQNIQTMTNKLFKIGIFVLVLPLFASCSDFLDKEVQGNTTSEEYYDTRYKLQSALDAVYDVLQSDDLNDSDWRFGDATADDVKGSDEGTSSQMGQLVNFRFNTSNTLILDRWEVYYRGIHRANEVIANAHKVRLTTNQYSEYQEIREILGQAKFLRAYFYFNLVRTFGGVPIRPEVEDVENLVVPRSSKEECYAYIEKDLREAAIMLPARFNGEECGKAGCGAVVALLMKVLMYEATPGIPSEKWEEMVKLGQYFIEGATMTYSDILKYDGSQGEDWETLRKRLWFKPQELNSATDPYETPQEPLPQLSNTYSLAYTSYYGTPISYIDQWFQEGEFCSGSIFEVVFKESADGTEGDTNEGGYIFDDMYSTSPVIYSTTSILTDIFGTDTRRQFVLGHQQYTPDNDLCECGSGRYVSLKWYTPVKERPQYGGDNGKNRRVLRFADVVLMYAEAYNECGNGAAALEWLNKQKAQVNTINQSTALYNAGGYGYIRDQIYEERRMEFCFEWERFFDLVRQGRAASVIKAFGASQTNRRGYYFREGVNEIFPIPQTEIDISNGVVTQNPGY